MNQQSLDTTLVDLPLGAVRYYEKVASTNDVASAWAEAGAPDLALVVADEQTAGRGRGGRRWFTPPGSALAISLILTDLSQVRDPTHLSGLGSLAVSRALQNRYALPARIKWPNDVLVGGEKIAGVLAEVQWKDERLQQAILGIGVNVFPSAVPPVEILNFPATCVEAKIQEKADRVELIRAVLVELVHWRERLDSPEFVRAWEADLAYRDEWVQAISPTSPPLEGQLAGLKPDGSLRLLGHSGVETVIQVGELHLRPTRPAYPAPPSSVDRLQN